MTTTTTIFFSMTCHVEAALKEKIEKGEFVELEKLLCKALKHIRPNQDPKLEKIFKDGQSFYVPVTDRENRITGVRKWDQAFRVYAAIYSKANPLRAAEIMQYIHVINDAAQNYAWDNVALYDYVFCQKMAEKPYKSWAKVYMQLWTRTMIHPLEPKFQQPVCPRRQRPRKIHSR